MTTDDKIFTMQGEVHQIGREVKTVGSKVDEVLVALKGSPLAGDGGLVGRIAHLEKQIRTQEERFECEIEKIKEAASKSAVYQNILWTCAGAIASGVGLFVIRQLLGK